MFGDPVTNDKKWETDNLGNIGNFKNGKIIFKMEQLDKIVLNDKINPNYYLQNNDIVFVRSNGSKEKEG